jgi:hypothetical protein
VRFSPQKLRLSQCSATYLLSSFPHPEQLHISCILLPYHFQLHIHYILPIIIHCSSTSFDNGNTVHTHTAHPLANTNYDITSDTIPLGKQVFSFRNTRLTHPQHHSCHVSRNQQHLHETHHDVISGRFVCCFSQQSNQQHPVIFVGISNFNRDDSTKGAQIFLLCYVEIIEKLCALFQETDGCPVKPYPKSCTLILQVTQHAVHYQFQNILHWSLWIKFCAAI